MIVKFSDADSSIYIEGWVSNPAEADRLNRLCKQFLVVDASLNLKPHKIEIVDSPRPVERDYARRDCLAACNDFVAAENDEQRIDQIDLLIRCAQEFKGSI